MKMLRVAGTPVSPGGPTVAGKADRRILVRVTGRNLGMAAGAAAVAVSVILLCSGMAYAASVSEPTIHQGDTGGVVLTWQTDVDEVLPASEAIQVDGIFGPLTAAATKEFQESHQLAVDAIVGPQTWSAISAEIGPVAATSECATAQLSASMGAPRAAAGTLYSSLVLTNTSSTPCTTFGYPGVSYVGAADDVQVGSAAARTDMVTPAWITLDPGASAAATVHLVDPGALPRALCQITATQGLRVYPPNNTEALFITDPGETCANPAVSGLTVAALVPRP